MLERSILVQIVARIIFNTSGNRQLISTLCVKCGTLFVDDFHVLSFLIVAIKLCYPFCLSLLLAYIQDCQALEHSYSLIKQGAGLTVVKEEDLDSEEDETLRQRKRKQKEEIARLMMPENTDDVNFMRADRAVAFMRLRFAELLCSVLIAVMALLRFLKDKNAFNDALLMGEFLPYWLSFVLGTGVFGLVVLKFVV